MATTPLRIDIVSDVVCPWCLIGYLQLQRALDQVKEEIDADIHWQPFELNPGMPPEGQDLREHITQKYGRSSEQSRGARAQLTELGASLGFNFNYGDDMRIVNTFRAHQLLNWAVSEGLQTELKLALFTAFFSNGKDVSQHDVLVETAAGVGLDGHDANAILNDARFANTVREEQQQWLDRDVHAVPAFSFDGQYPLPGAQGEETFVRYLKKIAAKKAEA